MSKRRGRKKAPFKLKIRMETMYSLAALVLIAWSVLLVLSFAGKGQMIAPVSAFLLEQFGMAALLVPFLLLSAGLVLTGIKWSFAKPQVLLGGILLTIAVTIVGEQGIFGASMFASMSTMIQPLGAYLFNSIVGLAGFLLLTDTSLKEIWNLLSSVIEFTSGEGNKDEKMKINTASQQTQQPEEKQKKKGFGFSLFGGGKTGEPQKPSFEIKQGSAQAQQTVQQAQQAQQQQQAAQSSPMATHAPISNAPGEQIVWKYPPHAMLENKMGGAANRGNVEGNAAVIEQTLDSFGIKSKVREVNLGPAVTQYALEIALGTKLSKITALANDLALALAAPTGQIRIEAPIPGRSLVGIEIPNITPEFVSMKAMLTSDEMKKHKSKLAVAVGLNVAGQPVVADIAKMPHVMIAGATGSGKSVCINSFICSLLFRASPQELKLILVDPKRVELTGYNDIPHLLTPVIVEPEKVVNALKWVVAEMDRRYKQFAEVGVRNLEGYNELAGFQAIPYIVIVIDELADIMLFNPGEVEGLITRLAQMARATGIHLVLATQRPSVDVITGLIKANVPTRIAFNVSSMIDSRVILDMPGAEKLLGRGDMLYIPPDQAKPNRIQGSYISDKEIRKLIDFLRNSGPQPEYEQDILTKYQGTKVTASGMTQINDVDDMLIDAIRVILEYDRASASVLQRRLSIGYNRAARIIDQLFEMGLVGPTEGSKPREVNGGAARAYLDQRMGNAVANPGAANNSISNS
jgi:S-DNA-T family DNA segregation ATPase FtsK/SpoIIIE